MKIIDFRFRPNTPEILDGIKKSSMFKAACKAIGFDARKPQALEDIVQNLDALGVETGVITGRDCETTYGSPSNNPSVLSFCRAFPGKFAGFWGIDPHKKMAAVREIARAVTEYGMKGIAVDPIWRTFPLLKPAFTPSTPNAASLTSLFSSPWPRRRRCLEPFWNMPTPAMWTRWPETFRN